MKIIHYPNSILRRKAAETEVNERTVSLAEEMLQTMNKADGVGLAAPQVGIGKRIVVFYKNGSAIALFNPKVIKKGELGSVMEEGCLSLPGLTVKVWRSNHIVISALNTEGKEIKLAIDKPFVAHAAQHEIDHLNGVLILDYLPFWEKWRCIVSRLLKRK